MVFVEILLASFGAAAIFLSIVFVAAWKLQRIDSIDAFWGPAFIVVAYSAALQMPQLSFAAWVVLGLVSLWGIRLFWHIFRRFLRSTAQDPRYDELMKTWPTQFRAGQVYVRIFMLQALLASVVSAPVVAIIASSQYSSSLLIAGAIVWAIGFCIEAISDSQLKQFLKNKAGAHGVMHSGLWRYSRHPNYFGELMLWWGIGVIALGSLWPAAGVVGPLAITLLICFVSGIPPAEKRAAAKNGWAGYKQKTSVLFPWPPKK